MWLFRKPSEGTQDLAAKPEGSPLSFLFSIINNPKVWSVCLACLEVAIISQEGNMRLLSTMFQALGQGVQTLSPRSSPVK